MYRDAIRLRHDVTRFRELLRGLSDPEAVAVLRALMREAEARLARIAAPPANDH